MLSDRYVVNVADTSITVERNPNVLVGLLTDSSQFRTREKYSLGKGDLNPELKFMFIRFGYIYRNSICNYNTCMIIN